MGGRHTGPEGQVLPDIADAERQPASSDIDPHDLARRPIATGRALQLHLRDLLQQVAKLNDIAVADRIVVLPTMDKHNDAEIAVLRFHLDAVEQCRDLVAVVGLSLVIELDKAQQERLIGMIVLRVRNRILFE
jgi:hypothetical protein